MFRRIESTAGDNKPLVVLLVLVGVFAITVAIQVTRFAGAADASSEPASVPPPAPGAQDPTTSDSGSTGKPGAGSGTTPDATSPPSASPSEPSGPSGQSADPSDPGVSYTISGTARLLLNPGGAVVPIDVGFSNPNVGNGGSGVGGVRVSSLVVSITSVTGSPIDGSRSCTASDFAVSQFSGAYPFFVPHGASTLSSLGFEPEAWPTVRMKETGTNQNGCKGATVALGYTGAP